MKPIHAWRKELEDCPVPPEMERVQGRGGETTLRVGSTYLHSRYRPREEAARLIDSAELDLARPILVIGLGLGYHVCELAERGAEVAVIEANPAVARLALEGPLANSSVLLAVGDPDEWADTETFRAFAKRQPQILVHPPSAKLKPGFAEAAAERASRAALAGQRLHIAVVGPMFGGSLPIAGYLEQAFARLGHRTLLVDNAQAWALYQAVEGSVKTKQASGQLTAMLTNFLSEWSYARAAEFAPDLCIVLAQAPVGPRFPARMAQMGAVTAFWYVENWRHLPYWKDIAPHYDYFFHIQPGDFERQLDAVGCPAHAFVQTGCDPEVHRPVELSEAEERHYGCDLSFAGAGYYNRIQLFKGLTDYAFKIWGVEWHASELRPLLMDIGERFTPDRFARIVAGSKINLNLHSSTIAEGVDPHADALNPRVFEIAACGGFQLCDPCIGLERVFDTQSEVPVYRNLPELRKHIDYYLAHPDERRDIAQRARERALREHTYTCRAQTMLDHLLGRYGGRILRKGVRVQRSMAEMAERLSAAEPLGAYLATLPEDMMFTHENINACLAARGGPPASYPEQLFTYLREVRDFAETLLGMQS